MSPPPRRKPAALAKFGAAVIIVAANAPRRPRREITLALAFVMVKSLSRVLYLCARDVARTLPSHPQMQELYATMVKFS